MCIRSARWRRVTGPSYVATLKFESGWSVELPLQLGADNEGSLSGNPSFPTGARSFGTRMEDGELEVLAGEAHEILSGHRSSDAALVAQFVLATARSNRDTQLLGRSG
jgi:hypothetical protein